MKKSSIILLIVGFAVLFVGGIVFVGGMTVLEWDFVRLDTTELQYDTWVQQEQQIDSIYIDSEFNVSVVQKNVERISVDYFYGDSIEVKIDDTTSQLKIQADDKGKFDWYPFGGIKVGKSWIKVVMPIEFDGDISIKQDNGKLKVSGINTDHDLKINNKNGLIELKNITTTTISIDSNNSNSSLDSIVAKSVDIRLNNGNLIVQHLDSDNTNVQTNNSNVSIGMVDSKSNYNITVSVQNGKSNISDQDPVGASKNLRVSTKNGKISVVFDDK